jgi:hypothetical protein
VVGLFAGLGALWASARVVPADLVLRPDVGDEYRLETYRGQAAVPVVLRLEAVPCVVPYAPPCTPGWREAALAEGALIEVEAGALAGLLHVDGDEFQHPALRVRILDGRHAGRRGFVSRWSLRRREGPGPVGVAVLGAVAAGVGLFAGAVSAALLALVRSGAHSALR